MSAIVRSKRDVKQTKHFGFEAETKVVELDEVTDEEDLLDSQSPEKPSINKPIRKVTKNNFKNGDLFDQVHRLKALNPAVDHWISDYKSDKVSAMVDLINFVLMAAGSKENWIARDVDLEALGPTELDDLLHNMMIAMTENDLSKYPLTEKNSKSASSFRTRFQNFFELLTDKVRALPVNTQRKSLNASEILHTVVDQLISLSSMALVNVRDAVTEAALSIGQNLLRGCGELKDQIAVAQRQISAEEAASKNTASLRSNPKYTSCVKVRDTAAQELEGLSTLCNTLFNSVLVHRLKDYNEEVRVVAVRHLHAFLRFDPRAPLRAEFLKYVGFSCSDFSAVVRLEAVKLVWTLLQDDTLAGYLQQFVEHFMERFIEICSGDLDHAVALQMVQAFRAMQRNGLLDTVPEEKLDLVDRIVFDSGSSDHVREEALGFLMDHTEGFDNVGMAGGADTTDDEEDDEEEEISSLRKKKSTTGKKLNKNSDGGVKALARRQRTALQLETFTEFAMHHLEEEDYQEASLLARACLLIPGYAVLFDWSTMISLLLRESDELISSALRPQQATILLHLFVTSAMHVRLKRDEAQGKDASIDQHWEALNVNLQRSLASLLMRFRDDEDQLAILASLLQCCDFSGSSTTSGSKAVVGSSSNTKSLKGLLKILVDVYLVSGDGVVLRRVTTALRTWRDNLEDSVLVGLVSASVADLVQACWQAVVDSSQRLESELKGSGGQQTSRRKSSPTRVEILETVSSLSSAVGRFKMLSKNFDCIALQKEQIVDDVVDILVDVCGRMLNINQCGATDADSEELLQASVSCASNCAYCLMEILLWTYRELVDAGKTAQTSQIGSRKRKSRGRDTQTTKKRKGGTVDVEQSPSMEEGEGDEGGDSFSTDQEEHVVSIAERLAGLRHRLVAVLSSWMQASSMSSTQLSTGLNEDLVGRHLSLVAFRLIFDLRSYFPVRHCDYRYVDDLLPFRPSKEVLLLQKTVFDSEGRRITALMGHEDDSALALQMLQQLLFPFSRTLLFDFERLNKHQSSSVVKYLLDGSEAVQEGVRVVLKRLKDLDVVKYLEVQLVALKAVFEDQVLRQMHERMTAEQQDDEDSFDLLHYRQLEEQAYTRAETLARKLSVTMGVGKLKEALVVRTMENLLKVGITYCLQTSGDFKVWHLGFASLLTYYVRFLPPQSLKVVADHLTNVLEDFPQIAAELDGKDTDEEMDEFVLRDVDKLRDFSTALQGGSRPKMVPRRRSTVSGDNDSVTSRNVSPAPRVSIAKAKAASSVTKKVRSSVVRGGLELEEEGNEGYDIQTQRSSRSSTVVRPVSRDEDDEMETESRVDSSAHNSNHQIDIAYGLDIEDDEPFVEEDDEDFLQAHKKKGVSSKKMNSRAPSQSSSQRSSRSLAAVLESEDEQIEDDEDEMELEGSVFGDLGSFPSTRSRYR